MASIESLIGLMSCLLAACISAKADSFDCDYSNSRCKRFLNWYECCDENMCRGNSLSNLGDSNIWYKMVQYCPQEGDINMLCMRPSNYVEDLLPVTGNGTTFYNKHCALCYNVSEYISWPLNITCTSYVIFQDLPSPEVILEKALRNRYCTVELAAPTYVLSCEPRWQEITEPITDKSPLSILLNFNTETPSTGGVTTHRQVQGSQNCSVGQWRHHSQDVCHNVKCAEGKRLVGEKCVSVIDAIKGLLYHFSLAMVSTEGLNTSVCAVHDVTSSLVRAIITTRRTELYNCTVNSQLVNVSESGSSGLLEVSLDCKIVVTEPVYRDPYEEELLTILDTSWNITCDDNELQFDSNKITGSSKHFYNAEGVSTTRTFARVGEGGLYYNFNAAGDKFTEVSPFLLCRYIVLNGTQYNEDKRTDCIILDERSIILCDGEFRVAERSDVHACVDTLQMKYDSMIIYPNSTQLTQPVPSVHGTIQFFLSHACIILSMSCLLATFIVYLIFPSLRSLPAKNNICLIFNLFWAQGLIQFGINLNVNRLTCQIIGVLIHFFWLSALLSMNVCCFHMYSVFSYHKMAITPQHSSTKRLIKYILYTYMVAGLLVAATILSQYIQSEGNTIGYGERYCYLSSAALVGFAFALPLGVILCINVMMFVMAVKSIAQTSRIENEVLSRGRNNLQVYIKLSTLTGLFWVFGIFAELFKYHALVYLSIVLNGSQGVFIFIACVCNKRVLRSDKKNTTKPKTISKHFEVEAIAGN